VSNKCLFQIEGNKCYTKTFQIKRFVNLLSFFGKRKEEGKAFIILNIFNRSSLLNEHHKYSALHFALVNSLLQMLNANSYKMVEKCNR